MYSCLAVIPILGTGMATLGAVMLAKLAYQDFKKRRQERQARGVFCGAALLAVGFLLIAGCYAWQIGGWCELLLLLATMGAFIGVEALVRFITGRSRRS